MVSIQTYILRFQGQLVKVGSKTTRSPNGVSCQNIRNFADMAYIRSIFEQQTYSNLSILKILCENI